MEPKQENNEIVTGDGEGRRDNPNPILSFLSKFPLFNFPQSKREAPKSKPVVSEIPTRTDGDFEEEKTKPVVVKLPRTQPDLPVLKLEAEDTEQNTNPIVLWQVYAIGGFFVLKWVIARLKERRAKKRPSDEEPPPADE